MKRQQPSGAAAAASAAAVAMKLTSRIYSIIGIITH